MRTLALLVLSALPSLALAQRPAKVYTHADSVRGGNGPGRAWWDATFYDLHVSVNPADSSVRGYNAITYRVIKPSGIMQIDLQMPLEADSIVQNGEYLTAHRDGNALFVPLQMQQRTGAKNTITY